MSVVLWLNATESEDSPGDSPGDIPAPSGEPRYDARALRQGFAAFLWPGVAEPLGARAGVRPDSAHCVTITAGRAEVAELCGVVNTGASAITGPYVVAVEARAHPIPPPDDQPRQDAIVLRVADDDEDGTGKRDGSTEYLTGQPSADPKPPDMPRGDVLLAVIDIPADGAATIAESAASTVASGGVLPVVAKKALPRAGIYPGAVAWLTDTDTLVAVDATGAWQPIASPNAHAAAIGVSGTASNFADDPVTASGSEFVALDGGPAVTVDIGPSGRALVLWGMRYAIASEESSRLAQMRIRATGANEKTFGSNQCEGRNSPKRSK
ncbi:MAG: hypothetical protein ACRD0P_16540, partial [Stackebrandtia sp.]